ncbi:MAG TPA: QsdR family transcriptional regulator [Streptosporangiaceae bacterium]|nr:QsdR family transcriptional regulator [Streptosporangiaceae bacterium]
MASLSAEPLSKTTRPAVGPLEVLAEARRRFAAGRRLDMRELAADMGISRATLYRWVGDRERLLGEVLWGFAEAGLEQARSCADANATDQGADWVARFCLRFMETTATFQPIRRFVEAEPDAALRVLTSHHGVQHQRLIATLRLTLEERAAAGYLDLPMSAADLAYVINRVAESFIWREFITGEQGGESDLTRAAGVVRILLGARNPVTTARNAELSH